MRQHGGHCRSGFLRQHRESRDIQGWTIFVRGETASGTVIISMQTNDSAAWIYFTRDGSTPTRDSMVYQNQSTTHVLPGNKIVSGTTASHGSTVKAFAYSTRYGLTSDITTVHID